MTEALNSEFLALQAAVAGRYSLEHELGRGGMGIVYLARDVALDRPVAIKLLPPSLAAQPALRERFLREARTAAKLSHPHIVPIFAVEEVRNLVFFVMAYVEGETLGQRVRQRGPLPASEVTRVLREIAWALAYAHGQGVVHRDIKADNILLESGSGRALVADFGIARRAETTGVTGVGEVVGTVEYMSPEQASGAPVDGRSDLYSLGVVGYYALSGRLPFDGANAASVLAQHITQPAPPIAEVATEGVPSRLARIVDRCLLKIPGDRFQKAEDLADAAALSLEARRELPISIRVLFKRLREQGQALGAYPFLYTLFGIGALTPFFAPVPVAAGLVYWIILAILTAMPPVSTTFWLRRVLRAGYSRDDVLLAWKAELDRELEERAFEHGRGPSRLERAMRWKTGAFGALAGGSAVWLAVDPSSWAAASLMLSLATGAGAASVAFLRYQRRTDLIGRWIGKMLHGWVGRAFFQLARLGLRRDRQPALATHRPTELAIGMAVDGLFASLPPATQQRLRDLPATVRGLENDATRMRQRIEELTDLLAQVERAGSATRCVRDGLDRQRAALDADVRAARDAAQQRLADAVAALEGIRLELLRLCAGAGSVDSLTADLAAARAIGEEVERLLAGRAEVTALLAGQ